MWMLAVMLLFATSALSLLDGRPSDKAWSVLHEGLENKSAEKRAAAIHALGLVRRNSNAQALAEKALQDDKAEVRAEAAQALAEMSAGSARPKLIAALNDNEVKVVIAAANALYVLKDPAAYQVYYTLLTGERKSSSGLVQTQLNALKDRKQLEKMMFEAGIGFIPYASMGWDAWKVITHDDSSAVQAAAAEKLATDPDPKSAQALAESTSDKKWRVRAGAASAIARRGDPKLIEALVPLLFDDNDTVRYEAAGAVLRLTAPRRSGVRATRPADSAPRGR
jgi:HEAT repeat protein